MTYLELIALINQWIITNGNREITAAVLNPVLRAMTDWTLSVTGILSELNTSNKSNLVAAINEVNQNLANIDLNVANVYSGLPNPNTTPPPSFETGDFYRQIDAFNNPVALFLYDGNVWQNVNAVFSSNGITTAFYTGVGITVPDGFSSEVVNLNNTNSIVTYTVAGTTMTITGGVDNGDRIMF